MVVAVVVVVVVAVVVARCWPLVAVFGWLLMLADFCLSGLFFAVCCYLLLVVSIISCK